MQRRRLLALTAPAVVAGMILSTSVTTATPSRARLADTEQPPTIVGLGDSFISGEGVLYANHNFGGKDYKSGDAMWNTAVGTVGGNPETSQAVADTWGQIFGDANGYPETGGKESVPYCDRSYAAPMHIGGGWASTNLACSGAIVDSVINKDGLFKPGIDDKTLEKGGVVVHGQAKMLGDIAATNKDIKVVALSIGGNDFGFAEIAKKCITDQSLWSECEKKSGAGTVKDMVEKGIPAARAAVTKAIGNIANTMAEAGYDEGDWKLVYQNPPLPVPNGANIKYSNTGGLTSERPQYGGCGLYQSTLDWIYLDVYPKLSKAMGDGVEDARGALGRTQVVQLDTEHSFDNHKLCEKSTIGAINYPKNLTGKTPPWQDDNGQKTEWVTFVSRSQQLFGNTYQGQMALHPNFWGQRALSDCLDQAKNRTGAIRIACVQDGDGWDETESRPDMKLQEAKNLWVVAVGKPVITGHPNVGQTVTAEADHVFEPSDAAVSYSWRIDGAEVGTDQTYAVQAGDIGKELTVQVTGAMPGIPAGSAVSEPITISDLTVLTDPSISGTPQVGQTLTADPGTYSAAPTSTQYQWLADGEAVDGATSATFVTTADELDKEMSVEVSVTATGFLPLTIVSAPTTAVTAGTMTVAGKPAISGTATTGKVLTAQAGSVVFTPDATSTEYHWFRDGETIPGQTEPTYELTDGDQGKKITVKIVGYRDGYTEATSDASDPTQPVSKGAIERLKTPTLKYYDDVLQEYSKIAKGARIGLPIRPDLTDVFSEWPDDPEVTWYLYKDGKKTELKNPRGLEYVASPKDIGGKVEAEIRTTNPGFQQAEATTEKVKVIKGKPQPEGPPLIAGTPKVGKRLRCDRPPFTPSSITVKCKWLRNGKMVKKGQFYKLSKKDKGKKMQVKVYTTKSKHYLASSIKSGKTKKVKG